MTIEAQAKQIHKQMHYDVRAKTAEHLLLHQIQVEHTINYRQVAVKVRNFHFSVLSCEVYSPPDVMLPHPSVTWKRPSDEYVHLYQELIHFSLQCLFLLKLPLGEVVAQRTKSKQLSIVSIRPLPESELSMQEKINIQEEIKKYHTNKNKQITYGCDLEFMLVNQRTKKYLNAASLTKQSNSTIGVDQAIALHQFKVSHPIVELRPRPGSTMKEMFLNLYEQYTMIDKWLTFKEEYALITSPSINNRFFLGGHLHFGNIPFTFKHVALLDQLFMVPFSLIEESTALMRRRAYGRLGSVKSNQFGGFEYRAVSSWVHMIPNMLAILQWIQYVVENATSISIPEFEDHEIQAYYQGIEEKDRFLNDWLKKYESYVKEGGQILLKDFVNTIKKLY